MKILSRSIALLTLASSAAWSAAQPYQQNFDSATADDSDLGPFSFVESNVGTAGFVFRADSPSGINLESTATATTTSSSGVAANTAAAINITGIVGNSFTISSEFTLDAFSGSQNSTVNFALVALDANSNFSDGVHYRIGYTPYTASSGSSQRLFFSEFNGAGVAATQGTLNASTINSSNQVSLTLGAVYNLTLEVTYTSATTTSIVGRLLNEAGETLATVAGTDSSAPTGEFFGYRTAVNAQRSSGTGAFVASQEVHYDNLSVSAIPEPATALSLLGGLGVLAMLRRRKA